MGINPNLPATMQVLTEQERIFVVALAKSGDTLSAKKLARYPDTTQTGHILRRPVVAVALRAEITRIIAGEGAAIGLGGLMRIAKDSKAPAAAQVAAQKALLQAAGFLEAPQEGGNTKPINEMGRDELRAFIDTKRADIAKLENEIADRARDITPGEGGQPLDPFE